MAYRPILYKGSLKDRVRPKAAV